MYLLNNPPRALLQKKYNFALTDAWLQKVQRASIRFNNGGSGSFVSPRGLVVTNHHIGADSLLKLSTKDKDLYHDGFYARSPAEELKCPDLELNVLQEIEDVTAQVQAAVKPSMSAAEALAARRAAFARLTKESQDRTGLRSDIVTLYQGGQYHLYRYQKYTDVRLVMAPEHAIAFFGGDSDNFEYPRYNLDVCFFRVYDKGQPLQNEHYFRWSAKGPSEGDLVFVSGHPGTTNRLETLNHLKHRRDVSLPYTLGLLRQREALLSQYAEQGPEQRLHAQKDLFPVANARKALTGQYQGLLDPNLLAVKAMAEKRQRVELEPVFQGKVSPWDRLTELHRKLAEFERLYNLIEKGDAFDSRLFRIARHLVRLAEEQPKDDGKRLSEYRSANLGSLKFQLLSPAPIAAELERVKLAGSLSFLAENLGGEHPLVVKLLAGHAPASQAGTLVDSSRLFEVKQREYWLEFGMIDGEEIRTRLREGDVMLRFADLIDAEARVLRQRYDEIDELRQQAYGDIARASFTRFGSAVPPDATFTLRLAFGTVQGYQEAGRELSYTTTFGQMYARAQEQGQREPFALPPRWRMGQGKIDAATPFNFVSTADTIGGNSGSPVLNRAGELVGINFDRNRHGLVRNFVYTDVMARHISVHSRAVLEALRGLYQADALVRELVGRE
jgi:hypothetical protein